MKRFIGLSAVLLAGLALESWATARLLEAPSYHKKKAPAAELPTGEPAPPSAPAPHP